MGRNDSDSDLSDVAPQQDDAPSPGSASGDSPAPQQAVDASDHESEPSDNDASDDGDFDAAESPASAPVNVEQSEASSSTSSSSRRAAAKRKAGGSLEEEYMRENPELYGLRRSVCLPSYKVIRPPAAC